MKLVRKKGICNCGYPKTIIKDESNGSVRYFYIDDLRSFLVRCNKCEQRISKSFVVKKTSDTN